MTRRNIVRTRGRVLTLTAALMSVVATSASAGALDPSPSLFSNQSTRDPWRVQWLPPDVADAPLASRFPARAPILLEQDAAQPLHAAAIQHSHGYEVRAKLHKYASFATLPLFGIEIALLKS